MSNVLNKRRFDLVGAMNRLCFVLQLRKSIVLYGYTPIEQRIIQTTLRIIILSRLPLVRGAVCERSEQTEGIVQENIIPLKIEITQTAHEIQKSVKSLYFVRV